jgi:hypothetical protein
MKKLHCMSSFVGIHERYIIILNPEPLKRLFLLVIQQNKSVVYIIQKKYLC